MRHREQNLAPSQFGFSTQPQFHREAKAALVNREQREITRINGGIVPTSTSQADPLRVEKNSALFGGADTRLQNGASAKFLAQEQATKEVHHKNRVETLKNERINRDVKRVQSMADEITQWDEDSKRLAGTGLKNRSSVGYNFIDGNWRDSSAAAKAKYHDDMVEYYARCRTQRLDKMSSQEFNIINGKDRTVVSRDALARPGVPEEVKELLGQAKASQEMQKRLRDRPRYELSPRSKSSVVRK